MVAVDGRQFSAGLGQFCTLRSDKGVANLLDTNAEIAMIRCAALLRWFSRNEIDFLFVFARERSD